MRSVKRRQAGLVAAGALGGAALAVGLVAAFGGFDSAGHSKPEAPVLAVGVAPLKGGQVEAYLHDPPAHLKVGQGWRPAEIGTAPIDGSGHFELRVDPKFRPVARDLRRNGGFINFEMYERGANGKSALTVFPRTLVRGRWTGDPSLRVNSKDLFFLQK